MANGRQTIVNNLKATIATIRKANGYRTDCGARVFVWRKVPISPEEIPCTEIRDRGAEVQLDGAPMGFAYHRLALDVEVFTDGGTAGETARDALADLMQALGANETLNGAVKWLEAKAHDMDLEPGGDVAGGLLLSLEAVYQTTRWGA